MIPCKPRLALMKPKLANANAFDHAISPRFVPIEPWLDCQMVRAAAMVRSAWIKVPRRSHARVFAPMRSPMRPMKAPARKVRTEQRASLSGRWKVWSEPRSKRRARAMASYTEKRTDIRQTKYHLPDGEV
jgi:hypothetical protein